MLRILYGCEKMRENKIHIFELTSNVSCYHIGNKYVVH